MFQFRSSLDEHCELAAKWHSKSDILFQSRPSLDEHCERLFTRKFTRVYAVHCLGQHRLGILYGALSPRT